MTLRFKRLSDAARIPARAHDGDAGLDLYAAESARIEPGERASVGTGVAVAIPQGHAGLVLPRSGLAARHGISIVNAPGTVDAGYRGEIRVCLINTDRSRPVTIARGDRIAQLVIQPVTMATFVPVTELPSSARGIGGYGSTGGILGNVAQTGATQRGATQRGTRA